MKRNNWHIALSVFLLAMMLVGRVGVHVFHHHDSGTSMGTRASKHPSGSLVLVAHESEADCALCKLDVFQQLALEAIVVFVFFLAVVKSLYWFLSSTTVQFSLLAKSRGPPMYFLLA